jgi:quercetin dioxygenase-like cupin family protein
MNSLEPLTSPISGRKSLIKPPFSASLRAGAVELKPGEAVGEHTTEGREEAIVVIKGTATVIVEGEPLTVPAGHFAYIPPEKVHNVVNRTEETVQYAYIVAAVGRKGEASMEHEHPGVKHHH